MNRAMEQSCHRAAYMLLQQLRGRPVGPFIRQLRAREQLDRAAYGRLAAQTLETTLQYAHDNVPLYSRDAWHQSLSRGDVTNLAAWPVLDRDTIRTRREELLARRRLRGAFYRASSASTGTPLRIAWNPRGAAWGWANEYRVMLWHGVAPGARTLLMWGSNHRLQDWVRNCRGFLTTELTPARLEQAAQYLLRRRPELCMGLPSALTMLARHVRTHYPQAPSQLVPFVKLGGEQVYPFQRRQLERFFGARVVEFYGCTEVGPIAAQCPAGSLHVMSDNVHLEIHRDGAPVAPGEFGDIVVTSLSNGAMPLVRCKNGDRGRLSPDPCACGRPYPVLAELIGRAADLFAAADGSLVHGSVLATGLESLLADAPLSAVRQVLFQQLDRLTWQVLIESDHLPAGLAAQLMQLVHRTFGQSCQVNIERVPVVPREPSGKFRYYRPASALSVSDAQALPAAVTAQRRTSEDRLKMV
jgi:phenylacetate-coenzyme A ligase PaaK-like adenylate-forming protein